MSETRYGSPKTSHVSVSMLSPSEDCELSSSCIAPLTHLLSDLLLDPLVRARDAVLQGDRRLPAEHLAQPGVVGVPSTYALRPGNIGQLDLRVCDLGDHQREVCDRDQPVLAEVERLAVVGLHQPVEPLDTIVDVAERPRLLAVAPDLDARVIGQLGYGHLPAHR